MAESTEQVVHIPEIVEVIPAGQMAQFREDLATMEKLCRDLEPVYDEARKVQEQLRLQLKGTAPWDKAVRVRAGELTAEYKRICKDAEDTIERYKKAVNRFKEEYIQKPLNKVSMRGQECKTLLTPVMGDWDRAETRQVEEEKERERKKVQAELDRQAELKRQADEAQAKELRAKRVAEIRADLKAGKYGDPKSAKANRHAQKLLEEAGAREEAQKAQAAAEEQEAKVKAKETVSTLKVESQVPTVPGNVKRVNYSAQCMDKRCFINEMISAFQKKDTKTYERLLAVVVVSDQKLSEEARGNIKTHPEDARHDLTVAQFEKLYPFVTVKEDRSY
jgi:hypothetical protein